MTEKEVEIIEKTLEKLLDFLQIERSKLKLEKEGKIIKIKIMSEDEAFSGVDLSEILTSFQLILSLLVYKKLGCWQKIVLNINDWQEKREAELKKMALNLVQKVRFSGQALSLTGLTARERRIIHLYLADHPEVTTFSEGEGRQRRLIIKPR